MNYSFFHCVNPFSQPHHTVYCHAVSTRFVPGSIGAVFFRFAFPGDPGVIIGEPHQSLALNREQTANSCLCADLRSNFSFRFDYSITPGRHTAVDAKCGRCFPGDINSIDAVLLAQYIAGWDVELDGIAADCNGDGDINSIDAVLLAQYIAGWDVTLG